MAKESPCALVLAIVLVGVSAVSGQTSEIVGLSATQVGSLVPRETGMRRSASTPESTGSGCDREPGIHCEWASGFHFAGIEGPVQALAVYDDGTGEALYIGGEFTTAGGVTVNGIAKWDGATWSALNGPSDTGVTGLIRSMVVHDDGSGPALYAGGYFATAGGVTVNGIAKWNGTEWSSLAGPSGTGVYGGVRALAVYDDGSGEALYAGGNFSSAGGVWASSIAKWNGTEWSALAGPSDTGTNGWVVALAVYDDGSGVALYAGGSFTAAGGVTVNRIAKWNGTEWSALTGPSDTGLSRSVVALAVYDDGSGSALYAGGDFIDAGGVTVNRIAKWNGTEWSALTGPSGTGADRAVLTLTVYDDGSGVALYAGGSFTAAGGVTVNRIAKWDGTEWAALAGPSGIGVGPEGFDGLLALAAYDDGTGEALYAGGEFHQAGGLAAHYGAKWDGTNWSAFTDSSGSGITNSVYTLAIYDDGSGEALYAGGDFTDAGGVTVNGIAKWDGSTWSALTGPRGTGTDGYHVSTLAVYDDGSGEALYAGGYFDTAGGVTVNHVAKWDGTKWSALKGPSGTGMTGGVATLAVYDDGSGEALYAGGAFVSAGGVEVNRIARWDGTEWSALDGPDDTGTERSVHALAAYDDGSGEALYAGGFFHTAGGVTVNHVAKWNGTEWSALSGPSEIGTDSYLDELAVYDDGSGEALYAGGDFTTAGGTVTNHIAKWNGTEWAALSGPSGPGTDENVYSFAVFDDGSGEALYAGGSFFFAGGVMGRRVAKWDGTAWSALTGPLDTGLDGTVRSFAAFDDGGGEALFAGGFFHTAGGVPSSRIARWSCCVDTEAPIGPFSLASSSHSVSVWSSEAEITVAWRGARDRGCAGLAGYSFLFDTSTGTLPDSTVDLLQGSDPHGTTSDSLADGQNHYFHLRTCDVTENCTNALDVGPYWIDATAPGAPSGLASSSHAMGTPSSDTTIDISWTAATDNLSGVVGYDHAFTSSTGWVCTESVDTAGTTASSVSLADGGWYAHVCGVDAAGNWGPVVSSGPYLIDTVAPSVMAVGSVADTGDGMLQEGESTFTCITQLSLLFSEGMNNPAGSIQPDDVTNAANYLLYRPGVDGTFDTTACPAIDAADEPLTVDLVDYDAPSQTSYLWVNGGVSLSRGRYRLRACGGTSLVDEQGTPLDGNGDGTEGDDFVLGFSVIGTNLLLNPNFDSGLSEWTVDPIHAAEISFGVADADEAPTSGSLVVTDSSGPGTAFLVAQCVDLLALTRYMSGASARVTSGSIEAPIVEVLVEFYAESGCEGEVLAGQDPVPSVLVGDTGDLWQSLDRGFVTAPADASSAVVWLSVDAATASGFAAAIDSASLIEGVLFIDGFESGDTLAWSGTAQ